MTSVSLVPHDNRGTSYWFIKLAHTWYLSTWRAPGWKTRYAGHPKVLNRIKGEQINYRAKYKRNI